jgi:ribonuclease HII
MSLQGKHFHTKPTLSHEKALWQQGFRHVCGVDEAGRGPLAGPVVAAACILPKGLTFDGVDDSKKLPEVARRKIFSQLTGHPKIRWATAFVSHEEIDRINILQATLLAMHQALLSLSEKPDFVLVDGPKAPLSPFPTKAIIDGDAISYTIACASIIAKVVRDKKMLEYHEVFPQYGFDKHKGYATKAHLEAIELHGPCPIHRKSFAPIKHT